MQDTQIEDGIKLLNGSDYKFIKDKIQEMDADLSDYISNMNYVINSFNNKSIVESFYNSGKFGEDTKNRLIQLKNALIKFDEVTKDVIIKTNNYLDEQAKLNKINF